MNPFISIISVNYRNTKDTTAFLESIKESKYDNIEVILVDNAPLISDQHLFEKAYPNLIYIHSKENLGFAGANNLGIKRAFGDLYYFLNNDTILTKESIIPLIQRFSTNKHLGAASPRIAFYDNQNLLQYAGMTPINPLTGRNKMIGNHEIDSPIYQKTNQIGYAHGAAMMIPAKIVNEIGPMETDYFLYYEELDWCEKIRQQNKEIEIVGEGRVIHKASASIKANSPLQTFYMTRNRLLFMYRFNSNNQFKKFWNFYKFVVIPKEKLKFIIKGDKDGLNAYNQALTSATNYFKNTNLPLQNFHAVA
ncbi:glycosyltransferase family 2 protein [Chondrinema litorale]|uniref:glycosyltransferase family 2 protein n=1 Tax=Chondrinema litorale TaxID=2994555 RepID=UPI002543F839|nr:glycosyltransferase family 2 protein [Chondrinema litorale]UZR98014.1 glycosyltransferase family 2 protein [Chondrinema litorale]